VLGFSSGAGIADGNCKAARVVRRAGRSALRQAGCLPLRGDAHFRRDIAAKAML